MDENEIIPCVFCEEERFKLNRKIGLPTEDSILYSDDNIFVTPDLCPLCVGHLLIISKKHYNSFACSTTNELNSLIKAVSYLAKTVPNGEFTVFEHGSVINGLGGSSVNHAHMHFLPYKIDDLVDIIEDEQKKTFYNIINFEEFQNLSLQYQPYLYVFDMQTHKILEVDRVDSQYLRRIVSIKTNVGYNWKLNYPLPESKQRFIDTILLYKLVFCS